MAPTPHPARAAYPDDPALLPQPIAGPLRAAMADAEVTAGALGALAGVDPRAITRWRGGQRASAASRARLARALDLHPDALIEPEAG